ncbi:MAG: hypothetical protein WC919_00520, partial [Candidatus Paceibacterota bacterium]
VGCVYSIFVRWPLYLYGLRKQVKAAREEISSKYSLTITDFVKNKDAFKNWMSSVYEIGRYNGMRVNDDGILTPPQYHDNKARLLTWAILWPWNVLWVCVRKPIIWIFEELLNLQILKRISQAMSNWMFKDFNK